MLGEEQLPGSPCSLMRTLHVGRLSGSGYMYGVHEVPTFCNTA